MAGYYVPLPGAEIRNSLVDFSPISNGLNAVREQGNQNRNALMQQRQLDNADKRLSMDQESHAQNMKTSGLDYQTKLAQRSAGIAQMIQAEKDPMRKAQLTERMYSMHPDYKANLQSAGLDPNDHDGVANFVIAQARGYVDPIEQQTKQAQLGLIKAQTNAANQRDGAKLIEVNGRIVRVAPNGQASEVYNAGPSDARLPQGYRWGPPGPDGQPTHVPISGGPADKLTETESKDALFAERMLRSERDLQGVAPIDETGKFTKYNPAQAANVLWPDKGVLANLGNSKEWQQYQRAARESLSAILRKDTGAAVTDEEFNTYFPTYFPIPGDSPEVIKQKQIARQTVAQGMRGASHRAFERMYPGYDQLNAPKTQPPAPPAAGGDTGGWGYGGVVK